MASFAPFDRHQDRKSPLGLAVRRFVLLTNGLDFPRVLSALEALSQWVDGDGTSSGQLGASALLPVLCPVVPAPSLTSAWY
jgi:hypothetical protein